MFKKIKNYFSLQRRIQIEILETLCTICLWLGRDGFDGRYNRNPYSSYMVGHFNTLKDLSKELRSKDR